MKRRHILQHRIDAGIENVHDFMGLKGPAAELLPLRPQDIHVHEHCDRRVGGRKCDLLALHQRVHRHYRLAEQEIGKAPDDCMLANPALPQTLPPAVSDRS